MRRVYPVVRRYPGNAGIRIGFDPVEIDTVKSRCQDLRNEAIVVKPDGLPFIAPVGNWIVFDPAIGIPASDPVRGN